MPLQRCNVDGQAGWRFGETGSCYVGENSRTSAIDQMQAMYSTGFVEKEKLAKSTVFSAAQWDMHMKYVDALTERIEAGWDASYWVDLHLVHDALLHSNYFESLGMMGSPSTPLSDLINRDFGSLAGLRETIKSLATYTESPWMLLVFDYNVSYLSLRCSDSYLPYDAKVLLAIDLQEHARILDFAYDSGTYIETLFANLNWDVINSRFEEKLLKSREKIQIAKSDEDEMLVFGWANVSVGTDGSYPVDYQGDVIEPEELEKAVYDYVLKFADMDERHNTEVKGKLVESVMFTKEKLSAMGLPEDALPLGWWVGFKVEDPEVFAKIKSGEYQMFSIGGTGVRVPIEGGE